MIRRACLLNHQSAEHTVKLVRVREQMVMEKYGPQFFIRKEALYQRLILSGSRNIVPAVRRPIGSDRIKFDQVYVMPHNIRPGSELKRIFLQVFREQVCRAQLNTVARIGAYDKRLHPDFLFLHHANIRVQPSAALQLFFQDEKASFRIVPAVPVIGELCLHQRNFKNFHIAALPGGFVL